MNTGRTIPRVPTVDARGACNLQKLPRELHHEISLYCGVDELIALTRVNFSWRRLLKPRLLLKAPLTEPSSNLPRHPALALLSDPKLEGLSGRQVMAFNWESCLDVPEIAELKRSLCVLFRPQEISEMAGDERADNRPLPTLFRISEAEMNLEVGALALYFVSGTKGSVAPFSTFRGAEDYEDLFCKVYRSGDTEAQRAMLNMAGDCMDGYFINHILLEPNPKVKMQQLFPHWFDENHWFHELDDFISEKVCEVFKKAANPLQSLELLMAPGFGNSIDDAMEESASFLLDELAENPAINRKDFKSILLLACAKPSCINSLMDWFNKIKTSSTDVPSQRLRRAMLKPTAEILGNLFAKAAEMYGKDASDTEISSEDDLDDV